MELDGLPYFGKYSVYSGGGFVADLGDEYEKAVNEIEELKSSDWIDRGSRAIFVEFNVHNPNINLFSAVSLVLEIPTIGSMTPTAVIKTVRLYNYVGQRALFRLILELIFVCFLLYFLIVEGKKVIRIKNKVKEKKFLYY